MLSVQIGAVQSRVDAFSIFYNYLCLLRLHKLYRSDYHSGLIFFMANLPRSTELICHKSGPSSERSRVKKTTELSPVRSAKGTYFICFCRVLYYSRSFLFIYYRFISLLRLDKACVKAQLAALFQLRCLEVFLLQRDPPVFEHLRSFLTFAEKDSVHLLIRG